MSVFKKVYLKRSFPICTLALCVLAIFMVGVTFAKSLYLASEHHQSLFDAWNINPDGTIAYQATYTLQYSTDPAGIAIDEDSGTIFITSEFSGGVEMVDPFTLTYLGVSSGPSNLAGIDVDDVDDIIYTIERWTDNLYIYSWDPVSQDITLLDQVDLPGCSGAFGIALDELRDILWVADTASGGGGGDRDIFEVTGLGAGPVDIEVVSGTFDSILGLFDASGNLIATDDDGGSGLLSRFSSVMPNGGTVYLGITGYSDFSFTGDHNEVGSYQIAVWPSGSSPPTAPLVSELEPNTDFADRNTFSSAGHLVIDGSLSTLPVSGAMVRAYDVNTWIEDTDLSFSPSHKPVDVAVDRVRNYVYTVSIIGGAAVPGGTGSNLLSKYDVATGTETTVNMGFAGVGVAVDEVTGYVYVTGGADTADNLSVWDTSTTPFTKLQDTGPIGNPAGLAIGNVSYNPLNLAKNDAVVGKGVYMGSTFTYEITFDNPNPSDVNNVTIIDTLPVELDFVSANEGGVYDPVTRTVTWDIGTIPAGESGPLIELVVGVNNNAVPGSTIYNYCTIDGDEIPPTTVICSTYIIPNRPPDCSASAASLEELWPPNHKYVDIEIMGVTDPDGDPVTITITGITQDEEVDAKGNGDGKTSPDGMGVGTDAASVRSERQGTGNGRVYEISFTATDPAGAECSGTVQICVPHDQSPEHECINDGQNYDSTVE